MILFATGYFTLEQTDYWTARLKASESLRGRFGNYSLKIEVQDLGIPPNKVYASLDVCVSDYNDNPPIFITPQHNITIRVPEVFLFLYFFSSLFIYQDQ